MKLYISTGNSRMEKKWNGQEMEFSVFWSVSLILSVPVKRWNSIGTEQGKAGFHQGCGWFCAWKAEGR